MRFSVLRAMMGIFIAAVVLAAGTLSVSAQAGTSSVTGAVTDAQGQAVVGANVVLVSAEQGTRRNVVTDASGNYTFTAVQPGSYTIEVEASGFNKSVTTAFDALTDRVVTIPVKLNVGDVTVTGSPAGFVLLPRGLT